MANTDDQAWGTWEELLLACAVNRHGTKSWESVAMEIQNRTSSPLLMTPQNCKQKYYDLQRRFMQKDGIIDEKDDKIENGDEKIEMIPWLDALRKLRVAELRREVQRYDVSIVSLQLKVRKLKEEREQSSKEKEISEENTDLENASKKVEANGEDDTEMDKGGEEKQSPGIVVGKRSSGDESERENQSFNESNSTAQKSENREAGSERKLEERLPKTESEAKAAAGSSDPACTGDERPVDEGSYDGSSNTIAKGMAASPVAKSPETVPARESGDSAEFRESVAESKGEEGAKENSDVQSSASLSKKRGRRNALSGSSSGDEPETDEVSPVSKRICVKSHPLMGFLEIIRSHNYGSVFERRLESQESTDYQSLIRQHIDLEMVKTKLEEGLYSHNGHEFFRDILLLFNNAILFFPNNSRESVAAFQLRQIVSKEMPSLIRKLKPHPSKEPTPPPIPDSKPQIPQRETVSSLPEKPAPAAPLVSCRKRSSITAKSNPAVTEAKPAEKEEVEEKPDVVTKDADNSSANVTTAIEPRVTKRRTKERSAPVARGGRTGKTRSSTNNNNKPAPNSNSRTNPSRSLNSAKPAPAKESSEEKSDKKNPSASTVAKKRSAANFLNRMKRSNSNNGTLLDRLKNSANSSNNARGGNNGDRETKKGGRDSGKKGEQNARREAARKRVPENSSPAKRSVGRPPKRAAPPPPPPSSSRRGKEVVEEKPPGRKRARR